MPRSQLSELLAAKYETSDQVAANHAYLGWPAPMSPCETLDAGETVGVYARMSSHERKRMDTAAEVLRGVHGDQAQRALGELLALVGRIERSIMRK